MQFGKFTLFKYLVDPLNQPLPVATSTYVGCKVDYIAVQLFIFC